MKLLRAIALRVGLMWAVLSVSDPAAAQSLTASTQSGRMTVLAIDYDAGRIVCLSSEGRVSYDEVDQAVLVVTDEARRPGLTLLRAGDIIRAESRDGKIHTITVLRRAWRDLEGPEG